LATTLKHTTIPSNEAQRRDKERSSGGRQIARTKKRRSDFAPEPRPISLAPMAISTLLNTDVSPVQSLKEGVLYVDGDAPEVSNNLAKAAAGTKRFAYTRPEDKPVPRSWQSE